jgi:hypothetical protein
VCEEVILTLEQPVEEIDIVETIETKDIEEVSGSKILEAISLFDIMSLLQLMSFQEGDDDVGFPEVEFSIRDNGEMALFSEGESINNIEPEELLEQLKREKIK